MVVKIMPSGRWERSRSTTASGRSSENILTTKLFQPWARAVSSIDKVISTEKGVVTVSSASTPMVLGVARAPRIFFADRSGT